MNKVMLITGTRKGVGRYLAQYYSKKGFLVIGCSRNQIDFKLDGYEHFCLDVADESKAKEMFYQIKKKYGRLDVLINNAGVASMNHSLLTSKKDVENILNTNITGTFLFCREATKIMQKNRFGRIVNFSTVAVPLNLEGEAIYASSKSAIVTLTKILGKELADFGITVNAIGPAPIKTDLIASVPENKIQKILDAQSIHDYANFEDVSNVIDFFIKPESRLITGQVIYLGGI